MRLTQLDIARLAKVSQATVSRVLAGDDRVEALIRDRVLDVVRANNYAPDVRARSLRTRRTGLIGLVMKRPRGGLVDDPFFAALTAGIIDYLCGMPYHLCVDMVTDARGQEVVYDEMLRTRRVDGLILVEPEASDDRIALLRKDEFPFVLIGNPKAGAIPSVDNDNVHAGALAARHLVEKGFSRIGFVAVQTGIAVSDDRVDGYRSVMKEHGLPEIVYHADFGLEPARGCAKKIFSFADRPDALVVLDDFMAFGVVLAAREAGLSIPEDVAIVSYNDSRLCHLAEGGLTSVSLNIHSMVKLAVSKLLSIIEGETPVPIRDIVPCQLIERGSSQRSSPR